jgi:hypothetical protein
MAAKVLGVCCVQDSDWKEREGSLLGECLLQKGICSRAANAAVHLYHIGKMSNIAVLSGVYMHMVQ